ncbi:ABC transporter permease subunit [Roseomonas sp. CCTCC AB2023176]|uniref:ABC transporter permease subunit n=1 Tax=Roseomonas sp. CCTCC AB2023176 TaxID=3342640 RepID=UPI0035DE33D3
MARSLGASGWRIFRRVLWPSARRAFWAGAAAVFGLSAGESLAPSLLSSAPGLAERIARHAWVAGDPGLSAATSVLLLAVLAAAAGAAWLLAGRRGG